MRKGILFDARIVLLSLHDDRKKSGASEQGDETRNTENEPN
jgi:hypothetical protein